MPHSRLNRSWTSALVLSLLMGSAPAAAGDYTVTLVEVKCIKPATGIEQDAVDFFKGFAAGGKMVMALGGPLLSAAGPKGAAAAAVLKGSLGAIEGGADIAQAIDDDRSPDDLYVLFDERNVWPGGARDNHRDMHGGQTVTINAAGRGTGSHTVTLMEYDSGSGDDLLGSITFTPAEPGPLIFQLISTEEDSSYLVEFMVTGPVPGGYTYIPDAAISGHNREKLRDASVSTCASACDGRSWCRSFDYNKQDRSCDLSDAAASSTGLKFTYDGNPYDHYAKPGSSYTHIPNAAISGHNRETLSGVTVSACASACNERSWCRSFDYHKNDSMCDLSDADAYVTGLKFTYDGNPYDHYARP